MKKLYVLFLISVFTSSALAQNSSCFEDYKKVFENRGAYPVEDGTHNNVILSNETKDVTECYICTVKVINGEVAEIAIHFEDDTKDLVIFQFKDKLPWTIHNGISRTRVTNKDEKIHLMFTDKIKPKKKEYKKAPLPKFELN